MKAVNAIDKLSDFADDLKDIATFLKQELKCHINNPDDADMVNFLASLEGEELNPLHIDDTLDTLKDYLIVYLNWR